MDNTNENSNVKATDTENQASKAETEVKEPDHKENAEKKQPDNTDSKYQKSIDKLQRRIDQKTAEGKGKDATIAELKKQVEELSKDKESTNDKGNELEEAKERIKQLEAENSRINQRSAVVKDLNDAGLGYVVNDDIVGMLVTDDEKQTTKNVKNIVELASQIETSLKHEFRKGRTPRTSGKTVNPSKKREEINAIQDPVERQRQMAANWDLYKN